MCSYTEYACMYVCAPFGTMIFFFTSCFMYLYEMLVSVFSISVCERDVHAFRHQCIKEGKACFDCNRLQKQWPDRGYKYFRSSVLAQRCRRQHEDPRFDVSHHFELGRRILWVAKQIYIIFSVSNCFTFYDKEVMDYN